jgi:hypothetical protein
VLTTRPAGHFFANVQEKSPFICSLFTSPDFIPIFMSQENNVIKMTPITVVLLGNKWATELGKHIPEWGLSTLIDSIIINRNENFR